MYNKRLKSTTDYTALYPILARSPLVKSYHPYYLTKFLMTNSGLVYLATVIASKAFVDAAATVPAIILAQKFILNSLCLNS